MLSPNDNNKQMEENFSDLLKEAEKGNSFLVATFLTSNNYSKKSVDEAFRCCMRNYEKDNEEKGKEYAKCFRSFIEQTEDFNYRNPEEDNQTILMESCKLGLTQIFDILLKFIKESKDKIELDLNISDNKGESVIHKLIYSSNFKNEDLKIELLQKFISVGLEIDKVDNNGYTALALSMKRGNGKISKELINLGANINHVVHSTGDTILHCAVQGKNPYCVTLLLKNPNLKEENKKTLNKKGEIATVLADKLGINKVTQLIEEVSLNSNNKIISLLKPFEEFISTNYEDTMNSLIEYKSIYNTNPAIEWNILMTQYMSQQKKLTKISENELKDFNDINIIEKMKTFFQNFEFQQHFRLLIFNEAIYYYKIGNYKKVIKLFHEDNHFTNLYSNHKDWILYLNINLIFLNIFLNYRQLKISNIIINNLQEFLNQTLKNKQNDCLKDFQCEYLNSTETLNNINCLDDALSVLFLYKSYKFLLENKSEESIKNLKEYKRISKNSKNKDQLPIFNTTKNFYRYMKIRIDYVQGTFSKCYKHLNSLNSFTIIKNNILENQIFYLNAIGIINMRQKKYKLAQLFFKNCLFILKNLKNLIKNFHPECAKYFVSVKYNLGLCHFHEKNYEKAYHILLSIETNLEYYPFLLYRIGLCCLELQLASIKRQSASCYNDIVQKLIGYNEKNQTPNNLANLNFSPIKNQIDTQLDNIDVANKDNIFASYSNISTFSHIMNDNNLNTKRVVLRNNFAEDDFIGKIKSKYLTDAIYYFKQSILLLKDNIYFKKEINAILNFCKYTPNEITFPIEIKSHCQLMTNSYLNLIFTSVLIEDWNEALFYADELERSIYYQKDIAYLIDNYKMQAYLSLNQHNQILELLKKNMHTVYSLEFKGSFFSKINKLVYNEITYKLALYINIIKMNFITNNMPEVEKGILSVLNLLNINLTLNNGVITHNDLPPFIFNLLIYYYIIKENYEVALNIIKRRKIPLYFVQNITQAPNSKLNIK